MNSSQNIAVPSVADYNLLIKQPSVINPYFLTHQSANLIEDFVREMDRGSSLFLLYGESGVGKSSLLRQIRDKRLTDVNTHWIDFKNIPGIAGGETTSRSIDLANVLKVLADKAQVGDVIFVDHFESTSNRAQHQLFESWSIDGRDKQLNFIVAASSSSFTIFRQLAQQMQIEARSFQLLPCSQVEAETYVQFVLFPEEPFAKLLMSHSLKQQLRACNGVFTSLTAFAEREGGQISIDRQVSEKSNVMPGIIIGILLVVIIASGYFVYSTQITKQPVAVKIAQDLSREVPSAKNPFKFMLDSSKRWIENGNSESGTIQIMSVDFDKFGPDDFDKYLQMLQADKVDVAQLRLFRTEVNNLKMYTIVYGEYPNRRDAGLQIKALPRALISAKPFPRTIGGILNEIEKIENN